MPTIEQITERFGPDWSNVCLFYSHPIALRFELGVGDHYIDWVLSAHQRAMSVLGDLFGGCDDLHLVASIFTDEPTPGLQGLLGLCHRLKDLGLPLPKREAIWSEPYPDENSWRCHVLIPIKRSMLARIVWTAVATDHRMGPNLYAHQRILSMKAGILAYPYDDRGMDVIGPNVEKLDGAYRKYRDWLLAYDLEQMDKAFARP